MGSQKWSYSRYHLKVELPGFADGFVGVVWKIKESRMIPK